MTMWEEERLSWGPESQAGAAVEQEKISKDSERCQWQGLGCREGGGIRSDRLSPVRGRVVFSDLSNSFCVDGSYPGLDFCLQEPAECLTLPKPRFPPSSWVCFGNMFQTHTLETRTRPRPSPLPRHAHGRLQIIWSRLDRGLVARRGGLVLWKRQ